MLSEAIRQRVLDPAHLSRTFLAGEEPLVGALAPGLDRFGHDVSEADDPSGPWAAGAMVASVGELARWVTVAYGTDGATRRRASARA